MDRVKSPSILCIGAGTGLAAGIALGALLWRPRQHQYVDEGVETDGGWIPVTYPRRIWKYMLTRRTRLSDNDEHSRVHQSACCRNLRPPRPAHFVLRPHMDARIDGCVYVRYDPPQSRKTGAIVIVIPGGNYDEADIYCGEGQPIAQWLVSLGITAVVLQYRCVSRGHYWPAPYEDWAACARQVRKKASSWGCDSRRVGIIGFSAGGHLASFAATTAPTAIKPDLQVLVYPAIDTRTPHGEDGAIEPWYADKGYPPTESSTHLLVNESTPPAFLAGITTDKYCPANENTDLYAERLRHYGVRCEYVTNDDDDHGCGLQDWWTEPCAQWLQQLGWAAQVLEHND